jgi:hypothetical protein
MPEQSTLPQNSCSSSQSRWIPPQFSWSSPWSSLSPPLSSWSLLLSSWSFPKSSWSIFQSGWSRLGCGVRPPPAPPWSLQLLAARDVQLSPDGVLSSAIWRGPL